MSFWKFTLSVFTAALLVVGFVFMMSTSPQQPKNEVIIKEVVIEKPVIRTEIKKILINRYVSDIDVNILVEFYMKNHPEDYATIMSFYTMKTKNVKVATTIVENALRYGMPINIAFGLAHQESKFKIKALRKNRNGSYDRGLFQLNDAYRKEWKTKDFYDPEKNTREAMQHLFQMYKKFDEDMDLALAACNAGGGSISRERIPFSSARHVFAIREYEKELDKEFSLAVLPKLAHLDFFE